MTRTPTPATEDVLARFSPATRAWFGSAFEAPTPAQVGAWDAISSGQHALVVAPTGSGKTLAAFLWALDRVASAAGAGRPAAPLPRALRLPAQGPRRRRRAQPAQPADRHPPGGRAPRAARARRHRRGALRRHPGRRAPTLRHAPARHPHHDAGVAVPDAHLRRRASRCAASTTVIVDEVHAVAGTKRGAHLAISPRAPRRPARPARAADRAVGDRPARRGGRLVPRRRATGHRRAAAAAPRPSTSRSSCRSTTWPSSARRTGEVQRLRRRRRGAHLDLAARRGARRRPHRRAPLDDRVRQLAAPRRAAHRAAQRDLARAPDRRAARARRPHPRR